MAAGAGQVVKLLDINSGRALGELRYGDTNDDILCLAFSPRTTNVLVTGGELGVIRQWNLATREITTFASHPSSVGSIAFSPDGKMLAAASHNSGNTLSVWNVDLKQQVWTTNTAIPPNAVAFTPDGKALVSGGGGGNGNARVWELATGRELQPFPKLHKGWLNHITFSPDGRTLATGAADDRLILWDFAERRAKAPPLRHGGNTMAFSADGRLMASIGFDYIARVWDVASQQPVALLRSLEPAWGLAFTPDSTRIVSAGGDRKVRLWDAMGLPDKDQLKGHDHWVHQVSFSPDGKKLASVDFYEGLTKLWEVPLRRFIRDLPGNPGDRSAGGAAFSPNGKLLVTSSYSGTVVLWDTATLERRGAFTNDFGCASLAFSPGSDVLAVATGFVPFRPNIPRGLAFWDMTTWQKINRLTEAAPDAVAVSFSNNGRLVAVGYHYGWLRLWDWETGHKLAEFQKHDGQVPTVAFSADDTLLASGGQNDEYVVLYSVAPARVLKVLQGHTGGVKSVAFAPDGKTLAAGGNDGMIRLWNLATHQPVLTLKKHSGAVTTIAFSRSGSFLASCGADADVRLWPAPSFDEIAQKETDNRK